MIIDTSALMAVLLNEEGHQKITAAINAEGGGIPAPARVEFLRVACGARYNLRVDADAFLAHLERFGTVVLPFTADHALIAGNANIMFGKGNGAGGTLNMLDLMVYAVAKERAEPLLCTGKDFAATDIELHAASRPY